jgi:adenosine deaminase
VKRPLRGWLERLPKVELHLHLEGAIPLPALWQLVQKYGGDPEVPRFADLEARFRYRDFPGFIATWIWKNGFLREYEDLAFVAEAVARDLERQNIRYVEAFCSPGDFARHGLVTQRVIEAMRDGLSRVSGVEVRLVVDLIRDFGPEQGEITLHEVSEARSLGVIGIGLGGSEHLFPASAYAGIFEDARELGFRTTAHAGEAAGAGSVWSAVDDLRADRIGHGTRAHESDRLLRHLAERRIPLEMCPLSNVRTGVVERLEDHPIRRYFDAGLLVGVNTDDPAMFHTSLAGELFDLHAKLGFSREELLQLLRNAIESSWMTEERKRQAYSDLAREAAGP